MNANSLRKYVSDHLPASRRKSDYLIMNGSVCVDGAVVKIPSLMVSDSQTICVNNIKLDPRKIKYAVWCYHKPRGLVTTHSDPEGRPTVFSDLPEDIGRVVSVGRLDVNTEGLLLITNCTAFARHMEMPSNAFTRTYRVRVFGPIDRLCCDKLKSGIVIDGVRYGKIFIDIDASSGLNTWLRVSISEGKNREIRKIMAHLGLKVARIIRVSYGPFKLGDIAPGHLKKVPDYMLKQFSKCFV